MNTELLNKVQQHIIDTANSDGTDLKEEFGTVDAFKQFVIAFTIRSCVEVLGMDIEEAFDVAMGDGAYEKICNKCWGSLQ